MGWPSISRGREERGFYIPGTPNGAPCFDWNFGIFFKGLTFKNRGLVWVLGMHIEFIRNIQILLPT